MQFVLNADQLARLAQWNKEQNQAVLARQRERMTPAQCIEQAAVNYQVPEQLLRSILLKENGGMGKCPYGGAIGGSLTYSFTPTSLGTVVQVKHGLSGETLDLSDYENW